MKPNFMKSALALPALLLLGATLAAQQTPTPTLTPGNGAATTAASPQPANPAAVPSGAANRQITLDVAVSDKSGQPQRGLQQQDFTLLDDKQPQKITSFRAVDGASATADSPVQIVLVVDQVNTSFQDVVIARQEIEKFLQQSGEQLAQPLSLVFFTDAGATGSTPSRDTKTLIANLNQTKPPLRNAKRSQGFYGAIDRLQLSVRTLGQVVDFEAKRPGRKLVIWISPTWPLFSGPGAVQTSAKTEQEIFNSVVGLSDSLRRARVTLYNVNPAGSVSAAGSRDYYKAFLKGVATPKQAQFGNLAVQVLAIQSGGLVLNSTNDIAGEIAACISDANSFYVITFEPAAAEAPNEYHALDIKVDRPGIVARTRTGYYAQSAQASTP
jgi:VWFA-related protein